MAAISFPFDLASGAPVYSASAVRQVLAALAAPGVAPLLGDELAVVPDSPAAMRVLVGTGVAALGEFTTGAAFYSLLPGSAKVQLTVPANATGSTRYDLVVLRMSLTSSPNTITPTYITGTASVPTLASLTRTASAWDLALAYVTVANGASSISAANITDLRYHATMGGILRPRGLAPQRDLGRPRSEFQSPSAIVYRHLTQAYTGGSGTVNTVLTPPAGFDWIILHHHDAASLVNSSVIHWGTAPANDRYMMGSFWQRGHGGNDVVVPNGQSIVLSQNSGGSFTTYLRVAQVPADASGRIWTKVSLSTETGAAVTPHATQAFVCTHLAYGPSTGDPVVYDNVSGAPYVHAPRTMYNPVGGGPTGGLFQLNPLFVVPPGRAIKAASGFTAGTYLNLFGYFVQSSETVV